MSAGLDPTLLGAPPPRPTGDTPRWRGALEWLRDAFVDNKRLKLVALILSLTVFTLVHIDEAAVAGAAVDVSYTLPEGKVLVSEPVEQLRITVKGSRRQIKRFDPAELDRVNIDLRGRPTGELVFEPTMIEGLPEGLELVSISPPSMTVALGDRAEREVPIVVETSGDPARGLRVARRIATPATTRVVGAASDVARISAVRTEPVAVAGESGEHADEVALVAPDRVQLEGAQRVKVLIAFEPELGVRRLGTLPVAVRAGPGLDASTASRLQIEPRSVELVVRGAVLELEKIDPARLTALVRPTAAEIASGAREVAVLISPPLPGVGIEVLPPTVRVRGP